MMRLRYASDGHLDGILAEIRGFARYRFDPESTLWIELSGHVARGIIRAITCSPGAIMHIGIRLIARAGGVTSVTFSHSNL